MSDQQSSFWNISSHDDDDDEEFAGSSYSRHTSSGNPFARASDDDEDYTDDYDDYLDDDEYDEDEEAEDDYASSYGSSSRPYGSSRYGSGNEGSSSGASTSSSSSYGRSSGYSSSSYTGSSSSYDRESRTGQSSSSSGGSTSYNRYGSGASYTGSSRSYGSGDSSASSSSEKDKKEKPGPASKASALLGRFRREKSEKPGKASSTGKGSPLSGIGARVSGGLDSVRKRLPIGGGTSGSATDRGGSSSVSNRASTTRTVSPPYGSPSSEASDRKAPKDSKKRFSFSLPFGLGERLSGGKARKPGTPRGVKRSKPLPSSRKRPHIKNEGLSLDTKLDLAGWGLLILAGIIFFGAISTNQGNVSRTLLLFIYQLVGVGWFAIPLILAATGIWLIWRHFGDNVPEVDYVHMVGWGVTYLAALTTFHFIHLLTASVQSVEELQALSDLAAQQGYGGGWLGGLIYMALMRNLGDAGTFVALVGWWGIGIIIATDLSFADIIRFIGQTQRNLILRLRAARARRRQITPITPIPPAETESESPALKAGTAAVLDPAPARRPALPPAETLPIATRAQMPVAQTVRYDAISAGEPAPADTSAGQFQSPPAAYLPPTQRSSATEFRMPARPATGASQAVPTTPEPDPEPPQAEDVEPELAANAVTLKPGSGPVRIRRQPVTKAEPEAVADDPPAEARQEVATETSRDRFDIDDDLTAADDYSGATNEVDIAAIDTLDDDDDRWMKPAQPRYQGQRVLRPLSKPSDGLTAAERAALLGDFADDEDDDDFIDYDDMDEDDIVYEDLPELDDLEAADDLDVIEIDDPEDDLDDDDPEHDTVEAVIASPEELLDEEAEAEDDPEPEAEPVAVLNDEPAEEAPPPPPPKPPEWVLPDFRKILDPASEQRINDEILLERARIIEDTLASFGAPGKVVEVNPGPVITQFGVEPDYIEGRGGRRTRVKVQAIARLADDLALSLAARSIRIEAPVPGRGFVGIEVPNAEPSLVSLRDIMESPEFDKIDSKLRIGLGQSVDGTPVVADLTAMPHLLIAGTTGSGKSVCVNAIIACLLMENTPDDLKLIMVDPKRVELTGYNGIPHLVAPVVVELERIVGVLKWVTREMDDRYRKFNERGARNIVAYNKMLLPGESPLPYLVVIVDELADLMMLAPDETERVLTRLAQMARATGIHLIISTQRPSVDVVTGLIKANFPARVAFAVASSVDSRVILDQPGAERLLGRGDMLFQAPDAAAPVRLQGVYVSDEELNRLVSHWKGLRPVDSVPASPPRLDSSLTPSSPTARIGTIQSRKEKYGEPVGAPSPTSSENFWDRVAPKPSTSSRDGSDVDELYDEAVAVVRQLKKASVSLLQRQLRIGYTRAARLIDVMEENGVVGPAQSGSKPRKVLGYSDDDADLDSEEDDADFDDEELDDEDM